MDRVTIQIDRAEEERKGKKGIAFYSGAEHKYFFIETVPEQRFKIKLAITEEPKEEYIDVLNM